jgi:hypothetical protein
LIIEIREITNFRLFHFSVTPREYLKYAKQDLKDTNNKGLINALSNAKRSIDCLIDATLKGLNINIKNNLPKEAVEFSNTILIGEDKNIQPNQLKLFCALGFAPSFLISEVRELRNKIEHDFELPERNDVKKAIEVAELLIETVDNKGVHSYTLSIFDTNKGQKIDIENFDYHSDTDKDIIYLELYDKENLYYISNCNEIIYYYLIRAMITSGSDEDDLKESIRLLINNIVIEQPLEYINIKKVVYA